MPEVFFSGPVGRIEGRYTESPDPKAPLALVLHPNPLLGGNMNNKVVYGLYRTLANQGFTVLRINFRGVGKSQGEFDNGIGEMTDAATALDWLQVNNPLSQTMLIAGFSFGSWIAMQLIMRRPEINSFIAVAPPVNKFDFSFLSPCPIPGLVIQGDQDSVVPEEIVLDLCNRLSKQKHIQVDYKVVRGADHFFREKVEDISNIVSEYLERKSFGKPLKTLTVNKQEQQRETTEEENMQKVFLD